MNGKITTKLSAENGLLTDSAFDAPHANDTTTDNSIIPLRSMIYPTLLSEMQIHGIPPSNLPLPACLAENYQWRNKNFHLTDIVNNIYLL
jgi:hypothetical protein